VDCIGTVGFIPVVNDEAFSLNFDNRVDDTTARNSVSEFVDERTEVEVEPSFTRGVKNTFKSGSETDFPPQLE